MTPQIKQRIEQIRRGEVPEGYKRTKAGVVPMEWEEVRIGDVLTQRKTMQCISEDAPLLSFTIEEGVIEPADKKSNKRDFLIKDITTKKFALTEVGDIIYNPANLKFGAIHRNNLRRGVVSPIYGIFYGAQNSTFMGHLLHNQRFIDYAKIYAEGTVEKLKTLSADTFKKLKITLPSLKEQEKIAQILSAQDKLIALKEKLIEEKKRQKKALMQQLLTGKQRFHVFFDEWCHKRISDICDVLDTLRKPLNASERAGRKKEYPYYGANGIVDYIDEYLLDDSVILLAEDGGNFENFNNKPIAYWVEGKCWVNNHAHILKPQKKYCEKFVFYALEHKDIRVYINGTTRSKLTQEDLLAIDIFLPTQIEEQQMIAKILGALDREVSLLQKDLDQEKQKKKALMQLLLTGIVRV